MATEALLCDSQQMLLCTDPRYRLRERSQHDWLQRAAKGLGSTLYPRGGRGSLGQRALCVAKHWRMLWGKLQYHQQHMPPCWCFTFPSRINVCCRWLLLIFSGRVWMFLTCRTGLVCVLGKAVGLLSHRIKSLRDRHLILGDNFASSPSPSLASFWPSSSCSNRRWQWSRYAAFKDRKRANHLRNRFARGRREKLKLQEKNDQRRTITMSTE